MRFHLALCLLAFCTFARSASLWDSDENAKSSDSDESIEHENVYLNLKDDDIKIKLNSAVDFVLDLARKAFTNDGQIVIPLKNVDKPFGSGLLEGRFQATGGYFKNPASLKRTGDVIFSKKGSSLSLRVALGLDDAEAGFDSYKLDLLNVHDTGKIHAKIAQNSISMKVVFTYSPECSFKLHYVLFDKLSGIKVDITGLGAFQSIYDNLSKWLIENFQDNLKMAVNQIMYTKLNQALDKSQICNLIPK